MSENKFFVILFGAALGSTIAIQFLSWNLHRELCKNHLEIKDLLTRLLTSIHLLVLERLTSPSRSEIRNIDPNARIREDQRIFLSSSYQRRWSWPICPLLDTPGMSEPRETQETDLVISLDHLLESPDLEDPEYLRNLNRECFRIPDLPLEYKEITPFVPKKPTLSLSADQDPDTMTTHETLPPPSNPTSIEVNGHTYFQTKDESLEEFKKRIEQDIMNRGPSQRGRRAKSETRSQDHRRSRSRSKSKGRNSASSITSNQKPKGKCRCYEKHSFCPKGFSCPYLHDYNLPLTSHQLRRQLDGLGAQLNKIRSNQQALKDTIDKNTKSIEHSIYLLTQEVKKLGLTTRDATQSTHFNKRRDIKDRAARYNKSSDYKF